LAKKEIYPDVWFFHGAIQLFKICLHVNDDTCLTAISHDNPGRSVPECLCSGFRWS